MTDLSREEINNIVEDCKESIALDQYSIKDIAIIQMHRESLSLPSVMVCQATDIGYKEVFADWWKCSHCGCTAILETMEYSPKCGRKIEWSD